MNRTSTNLEHSLDEVEELRKEREIKQTHLSIIVGFDYSTGWESAISNDSISSEKLTRAVEAIRYYDEKGYLPEPGEIQTSEKTKSGGRDDV